jgi:diacylglycerol kinase family enzyme
VGYVRKYAEASDEFVRVYAMGGSSTLFEVINGVVGLPNVQVAHYPLGHGNSFLRGFAGDKFHLFKSLRNLIFSGVTEMDVIRCGHNYGIAFGLLGIESQACRDGDKLMEMFGVTSDICYLLAGVYNLLFHDPMQNYRISLDGRNMDGDYMGIFVANEPYYGAGLKPGSDARPNDGFFDAYLIKNVPMAKLPQGLLDYIRGGYAKWPEFVSHYRGRSLRVSSDKTMCVSLDGEFFYDMSIDFELLPSAIDFVCPEGVDLNGAPGPGMDSGE